MNWLAIADNQLPNLACGYDARGANPVHKHYGGLCDPVGRAYFAARCQGPMTFLGSSNP